MNAQSQPRSHREGQLGTEIISWKRTVAVLQRDPLGSSAGILIFTTSLSPPKSALAARLPADCTSFPEPPPQLIRNRRPAVSRPQGLFFQLSRLRVLHTEPKRQEEGSLEAPLSIDRSKGILGRTVIGRYIRKTALRNAPARFTASRHSRPGFCHYPWALGRKRFAP